MYKAIRSCGLEVLEQTHTFLQVHHATLSCGPSVWASLIVGRTLAVRSIGKVSRGRNCRVDAQETVALRTPAFHQTSSPTRYPCCRGSDDTSSALLTSACRFVAETVSATLRQTVNIEHYPFGCFGQRRYSGGNIGDAESSVFSTCQASQPREFGYVVNWGAGFMISSGRFLSPAPVLQLKFINVHSPRCFCAVALQRQ